MRSIALFALLLTAATPLMAEPPVIKRGQVLRDAKNARLGVIDSVDKDGTIGLVLDDTYVRIPTDSIALLDGKLTTKLTRAEIEKR